MNIKRQVSCLFSFKENKLVVLSVMSVFRRNFQREKNHFDS